MLHEFFTSKFLQAIIWTLALVTISTLTAMTVFPNIFLNHSLTYFAPLFFGCCSVWFILSFVYIVKKDIVDEVKKDENS